jgi:hypothetical protein
MMHTSHSECPRAWFSPIIWRLVPRLSVTCDSTHSSEGANGCSRIVLVVMTVSTVVFSDLARKIPTVRMADLERRFSRKLTRYSQSVSTTYSPPLSSLAPLCPTLRWLAAMASPTTRSTRPTPANMYHTPSTRSTTRSTGPAMSTGPSPLHSCFLISLSSLGFLVLT